jgi:hypothetical protein
MGIIDPVIVFLYMRANCILNFCKAVKKVRNNSSKTSPMALYGIIASTIVIMIAVPDLLKYETWIMMKHSASDDKPGWYIPGYWSSDSMKINCSQLVTLTDYTIWLLDIHRKEMIQVISPIEEKSRIRVC